MDLSDSTTTHYALGLALVACAAAYMLLLQPTRRPVRWLQKKNYQYEVTFSLYMLTPTEKFVFNSIAFLSLSMLALAMIMYLPDHLMTISRRAYYYFAGDGGSSPRSAAENLYGSVTRAGDVAMGWAQTAYRAAMNRTREAAQEAATQAVAAAAEKVAPQQPPLVGH